MPQSPDITKLAQAMFIVQQQLQPAIRDARNLFIETSTRSPARFIIRLLSFILSDSPPNLFCSILYVLQSHSIFRPHTSFVCRTFDTSIVYLSIQQSHHRTRQ